MLRDPRKARPGKVVGLIFIILSISIRIPRGFDHSRGFAHNAYVAGPEAKPPNGAKPPKVHARYAE